MSTRGQSLVEFALIVPVMLTLFGAAVDLSRVYQGWIDLQSAARQAAEYAATSDTTSTAAQTDARSSVCTQMTGSASCASPTVSVPSFSSSTTAPGASDTHPVVTVTVLASMPFRTLFAYPFFTQNGAWTLRASVTYSVIQGRN